MLRTVSRYTLAIAIVVAVVLLKAIVPGLGTSAPFLLVSLTVGLVAWLTGRGPGVAAAIVAAVSVNELLVGRGTIDETQSVILLVAGLSDFLFMALVASQLRMSLASAARARRAAEDATRARDAFISTIAHELRTPLTSVLAYAELLARRLGDGTGAKEAQAIVHQTRRANKLIEDLLQAARLDVADLRIDTAPIDLKAVAQAAMTSLAPRLRPDDRVDLDLADRAPVLGDAMRLEQVLVNLLDNALKYSPDGASVELAVRVEGDHVVARVSDRGVGVPPEDAAHLFEPFYRARPGVASGLGLGLYVSEAIARGHGGSLAFEPRRSGGSTFVLRLPLRRPVPERRAARGALAEATVSSALPGRALQPIDELARESE